MNGSHGYRHRSPDLRLPRVPVRASVLLGVCEVCFADFGERDESAPALFVDRLFWDLNLDEPGFGHDDRRA